MLTIWANNDIIKLIAGACTSINCEKLCGVFISYRHLHPEQMPDTHNHTGKIKESEEVSMKKGKKFTAALLCIMMMLTMMPAMAFADGGTATYIDGTSTPANSSLQLSKSLTQEANGTYTIKMESYLNGSVESDGRATDFVVVLDQSGSMAKDDTILGFIEIPAYITIGNGDTSILNKDADLGAKEGFYQCKLKKSFSSEYDTDTILWHNMKYENNQWLVEYGGNWYSADGFEIEYAFGIVKVKYSLEDIQVLKVDAAKVAVRSFVDTVAAKTTADNDHRIAVVGFSSDNYSTHNKHFTKDKFGSDLVVANTSGLRDVVLDFGADGGTYTHDGMQMAEDIFAAEKTADADAYAQRGHVVVVITDGEPGQSGFNSRYADAALNHGDNLKSNYNSKIYTIGLNLNVGDDSSVSKFMNYLSSNYSGVKSMSEGASATAVDTGYYAKINSPTALTSILNSIANQYITIPDELQDVDGNAVLVDAINGDVFDITGVSAGNVSAYTVDMVTGDETDIDSDNITVSGGTVSVNGFDYTDEANIVTYENGQATGGKKLVVEITGLSLKENNILADNAKIDSNNGTADIKVGTTSKVGVSSPQMDGVPVTIQYYYDEVAGTDATDTVTKYSISGTTITKDFAEEEFAVDKTADGYDYDRIELNGEEEDGDVTDNGLTIDVYYTSSNPNPNPPSEYTVTYKQPTGATGTDVEDVVTVTATSNSYTLKSWAVVSAQAVTNGGTAWAAPDVEKEFDCWVLSTDSTATYAPDASYTITGDVTFVAKYKTRTAIVYVQPESESGATGDKVVIDVEPGTHALKTWGEVSKMVTPNWAAPEGKEFKYWIDGDQNSRNPGYEVSITAGQLKRFVAYYGPITTTVTVTYKQPTGVTGNDVTKGNVSKGNYNLLDRTATDFTGWDTPTGKEFKGWKLEDAADTALVASPYDLQANTTFVAVYGDPTPIQYRGVVVYYQYGGGFDSDYKGERVIDDAPVVTTADNGDVTVELLSFSDVTGKAAADEFTVDWTKPSKMKFNGWKYLEEDQIPVDPRAISTTDLYNVSITISADDMKELAPGGQFELNFMANYKKSSNTVYYTLNFETNGGSQIDSITRVSGSIIDLDEFVPTKKGYNFKGWYTDEKLTTKAETQFPLTQTMTVYAKWSEKSTNANGTPSDLNSKDHIKYVVGYPDGYVRPNNFVTRAETASMLYRLLTDERRAEVKTYSNNFTDVSASAWYVEPASSMYKGGYIAGYEDGTFGGDRNITRAEFVSMLVRFIGADEGVMNFTDVPQNHWAYKNIAIATSQGWTSGYSDGTFKPDQAITRAEAMSIINRVLNRGVNASSNISGFKAWPDNYSNAWYYYDVIEATNSHDYTGERPSENWSNVK